MTISDNFDFEPGQLEIAISKAMARPDQPLPFTGYGRMPNGDFGSVVGFIDLENNQCEIHASIIKPKNQKRPVGRPKKDGKRIAVLMLNKWLTTQPEGTKKGDADLMIADILGYKGEDKKRTVLRVLAHERTKAIIKKTKGHKIVGVTDSTGAGYWFMGDFDPAHFHPNNNEAEPISLTGWLLHDNTDEAIYGTYRFNKKTAIEDMFLTRVVTQHGEG